MMQNWHNFFFASYDAGGFITVDKPPVALWMQTISAKIFGLNSLSLLLPEALAGVGAVVILYFLVKRTFGPLASFLAATALAITPIAVAVDRDNLTDTWLMFTLLLAAWAMLRATEKGKLALLALSMALVGVAFNVKMLEAWIVLPAFYLLYMVAAPLKWYKRILHLAVATVVVLSVSLSWAVAVDLTPADQRPYVGGSQTNSVLELAIGYNGLGRVTGQGETIGGGGNNSGARPDGGQSDFTPPTGADGAGGFGSKPVNGDGGGVAPGSAGGPGGAGGGGNSFNTGQPGALRLVNSELAAQWSWLLPLAGFGVLATAFAVRRRWPLEARSQSLILWTGWLVTYGAVFSMASGIFHNYYLIMLAPPAAALAGAGVATLWAAYRKREWQGWLLPAALVVTAAWQVKVLIDYPEWSAWLTPLLLGGSAVAAVALLVGRVFTNRVLKSVAPGALAVGLLALALAPAAWASMAVTSPGNGTIPTVGPSQVSQQGPGGTGIGQVQGQMGGETTSNSMISYLEANQGGYFYLVAVSSANQASSIALETGLPVLAMGGFTGSDPAMTVEKLQQMVESKQVRFIMIGGGMGGGGSSAVTAWVQANGIAVDTSLYGGQSGAGGNGNGTLYDLAAK